MSSVNNSTFGLDAVFEGGLKNTTNLESKTQELLAQSDTTDLKDMLKIQQQLGKLTMSYGLTSGVLKSIKDTVMGIIQKIN
ncbi:MAG: hypothetical protein HAW62_02100 [Endozoicomonadaceae bacterium]|nr:hypothetical protein [Endozoicomonadaceae bacterium]